MPPKTKITKEEIVNSAVELVRSNGVQALNARTIAAHLNCSTQPIFSNFKSIDEVRLAVIARANEIAEEYRAREIALKTAPIYKASGLAYIRFAKEEKELFRLLYMRVRTRDAYDKDAAAFHQMEDLVHHNTGLGGEMATLFHLEMWAFVHGIATMFATDYFNPEWDLVDKMLTDAYQGLRKRYGME